MIQLSQAIVAVMSCTLAAGIARQNSRSRRGQTGTQLQSAGFASQEAAGGRSIRPSSVSVSESSAAFSSARHVVFLVCVLALPDAWLARAGIARQGTKIESPFEWDWRSPPLSKAGPPPARCTKLASYPPIECISRPG